jgi:hypothetical protein
MPEFNFVRSSYSNTGGECVEVARNITGVVAVRDSKEPALDTPSIVRVSPTSWTRFVKAVTRRR